MDYTLQAGSTVRLFHREHECYVAAEGSFTELPPVTEDGTSQLLLSCVYLAWL